MRFPYLSNYEGLPSRAGGLPVVLVKVSACGVCHTELDEIEGRTMPALMPIVLGHEVIGRVEELGKNVSKLSKGERVGVGWIHHSSGGSHSCP